MSTTAEFGRGKTIFVLAIVIGCFAVLWPKIFYPMLTASINPTNGEEVPIPVVIPKARKGFSSTCCDVISEKDTNAYKVMNELCTSIIRKEQMILQQQQQAQQPKPKRATPVKVPTVALCRSIILQTCGVDIIGLLKDDHSITTEYKKSLGQLRTFNTSLCMKMNFGVDFTEIGLPRKMKGPEIIPSHMRQERPFRPGPEMIHPALRERGRGIPTVAIPRRTIEREARPGPVPGMRPPVGGAGHIPTGPKGGGTMGIIMPMYTIGIVCFFLYTIMKILFKKSPEAEQAKQAPQVKDYGLDPEHRKYVFSEEYPEGSDRSLKETYTKEDMGLRRRPSTGKSSRFYEDRRRLESPSIIYPTYPTPSDLETKIPPETTTSTLTSSLETDMPATKENIENESSSVSTPPPTPTVISLADTEDEKRTDISTTQSTLQSENEQNVNEFHGVEPSTSVSYSPDTSHTPKVPISHEEPESEKITAIVEQSAAKPVQRETETYARKDDETEKKENLSRNASIASSADTIVAETPSMSEIEPPAAATTSIETYSSGTSPNSSAVKKQSSVVSPSAMGPFSPLAPDQTPNCDPEEFHFFDRTIVIPDYEPEDPSKLTQDQKAEVEDAPEITIVKQESVPQNVLDMASQVAEKILDAAKSESLAVAAAAEEEYEEPRVVAPTPSPAGETLMMIPLTDDDTTNASTITPNEPASDIPSPSLQPRLSLDTNITAAGLELSTNADGMHEPTNITETLKTSAPSEPSATAGPPSIQVETPHADQTELNKIAEYIESLNTEPKEIAKLAAVASSPRGEMAPISPIVTFAEESRESSDTPSPIDQTPAQSSTGEVTAKSKIEFTPVEDTQSSSSTLLDKLGLGDLPDICYVTQPLDENQRGRDRAQFLKSRVEIVSIDESLPASEPTTPLPKGKDRKASEPASGLSLGESSSPLTESLEGAMKKLRHVPGESTTPEEKKSLRKASTSSDHSQIDSPKPSEIDKYVDRLANMQESRKAMIEREMFKSSRSSQGSDTDQQANQSSDFHGPGLLDSGQIPEIENHHHPPDVIDDEFLDKMKEVEKWATATTSAVKASQDSNDDDYENNIYNLAKSDSSCPLGQQFSLEDDHDGDSKNERLIYEESLEREEPGTVVIEFSSTPNSLLEEAIKIATFVIDQALRDGIKEAVKVIVAGHEKNDKAYIEQLDQVMDEIGYGNDSREILGSVPKTELNSESLEERLLKSLKEEQGHSDTDNLACVVDISKSNLDDNNLRTDRVIRLTENNTQIGNQTETPFQNDPLITPPTNTTVHKINPETQETKRSAEDKDNDSCLTSFVDESNRDIRKITEECEIGSATTATATTSAEAFTTPTPTPAPATVESCHPFEPASLLPIDSNTTVSPPVPVVDSQKLRSESLLEQAQQDTVKGTPVKAATETIPTEPTLQEENQEPILAELETIQEEIDNLSTELNKMESWTQTNVTAFPKVQLVSQKAHEQTSAEPTPAEKASQPELTVNFQSEETSTNEPTESRMALADKTTPTIAQALEPSPSPLLQEEEEHFKTEDCTQTLLVSKVVAKTPSPSPEPPTEKPPLLFLDEKVEQIKTSEDTPKPLIEEILSASVAEELFLTPTGEVTSQPLLDDLAKQVQGQFAPEPEVSQAQMSQEIVPKSPENEIAPKHLPEEIAQQTIGDTIVSEGKLVPTSTEELSSSPVVEVAPTTAIIPPTPAVEEVSATPKADEDFPKYLATDLPQASDEMQKVQTDETIISVTPQDNRLPLPVEDVVHAPQPEPTPTAIPMQVAAMLMEQPVKEPAETITTDNLPLSPEKVTAFSPEKVDDLSPSTTKSEQQVEVSLSSTGSQVEATLSPAPIQTLSEPPIPSVEAPASKLTEQSTETVPADSDSSVQEIQSTPLTTQVDKPIPSEAQPLVHEPPFSKEKAQAEQIQPPPGQTLESVSISVEKTKPTAPPAAVQSTEELPSVTLRFEILSEPPFPLPTSTTTSVTPLLSQPEQNTLNDTDPENNKIVDASSPLSPNTDTIVSSCGLVVDSSSNLLTGQPQPSGASMALTVEQLDENSPEIFPLPSTNITTTTIISSRSTPPTSPVEKAQPDQSENAGVSLSATTDQASSATIATTPTTQVEVTAEKQATQASSALLSDTCPTTIDQRPQEPTISDKILSSSEIITDETSNVPTSPAPPPSTPTVSAEPPSFPISSKPEVTPPQPEQQRVEQKDDGANKESGHRERDARDVEIDMLRKRLEETEAAMERIVSQMGSVTDQLSPTVLAQVLKARGEDLEKLIASAEKSGAKKEDLGDATTPKTEAQSAPPSKPARREKREKSSEKEVKFKLPPEEMEVELEEEEIEEEEEVEIVRPPTPPKTLSKAKTKSPPPTPEPSGSTTAPLASSSSHRNHDELLISGMQTTVAGSAADITSADNQSKSPSPLIADYYNNSTSKIITPTDTPTLLHHSSPQPPPFVADNNEMSESVTIVDNHDNNKQSAAIAQAKAGVSSPSPTSGVSVIGIEETASLITGERWDLSRTPTPTFSRRTPPIPHRPPTPPDNIPSIYLEGPLSSRSQEIVVREAQIEVEGGDDYDYDDDYEPSGPVILSGKVTLSVISSAGGAFSHDEITEAPSLSLSDRAQAEHSRGKGSVGGGSSKRSVAAQIASAMNEQVRGKSDGKKSSNASSPDMDEYEVIGKATDQEGEKAQEDTAGDISIMDDLKQELLPKDEE